LETLLERLPKGLGSFGSLCFLGSLKKIYGKGRNPMGLFLLILPFIFKNPRDKENDISWKPCWNDYQKV
jgi:Na+-translocating ferredoxin:NAD+ oxidoreductase RnfE subunit